MGVRRVKSPMILWQIHAVLRIDGPTDISSAKVPIKSPVHRDLMSDNEGLYPRHGASNSNCSDISSRKLPLKTISMRLNVWKLSTIHCEL